MARTTAPISHEYLAKLKFLADRHKRSQTKELENVIDMAMVVEQLHPEESTVKQGE